MRVCGHMELQSKGRNTVARDSEGRLSGDARQEGAAWYWAMRKNSGPTPEPGLCGLSLDTQTGDVN